MKKSKPFDPMVDIQIFRFPSFRLGTMLAGVYFMGITSIWVLVALYFQNGLGYSALVPGSVGIPAAISSSFSANWAGKRVADRGRRVVIDGITVALIDIALITTIIFAGARAINWPLGTAIGFGTIGSLMAVALVIALYDNRLRARRPAR